MGIVIPFPRRAALPLPSHWNGADRSHFIQRTYDGTRTREEAIADVEAINRLRVAWPSIRNEAIRLAEQVKRLSP